MIVKYSLIYKVSWNYGVHELAQTNKQKVLVA